MAFSTGRTIKRFVRKKAKEIGDNFSEEAKDKASKFIDSAKKVTSDLGKDVKDVGKNIEDKVKRGTSYVSDKTKQMKNKADKFVEERKIKNERKRYESQRKKEAGSKALVPYKEKKKGMGLTTKAAVVGGATAAGYGLGSSTKKDTVDDVMETLQNKIEAGEKLTTSERRMLKLLREAQSV